MFLPRCRRGRRPKSLARVGRTHAFPARSASRSSSSCSPQAPDGLEARCRSHVLVAHQRDTFQVLGEGRTEQREHRWSEIPDIAGRQSGSLPVTGCRALRSMPFWSARSNQATASGLQKLAWSRSNAGCRPCFCMSCHSGFLARPGPRRTRDRRRGLRLTARFRLGRHSPSQDIALYTMEVLFRRLG